MWAHWYPITRLYFQSVLNYDNSLPVFNGNTILKATLHKSVLQSVTCPPQKLDRFSFFQIYQKKDSVSSAETLRNASVVPHVFVCLLHTLSQFFQAHFVVHDVSTDSCLNQTNLLNLTNITHHNTTLYLKVSMIPSCCDHMKAAFIQ